jgi:predicted AlkP superfamily pyrophosphatase or phosphodiesterase
VRRTLAVLLAAFGLSGCPRPRDDSGREVAHRERLVLVVSIDGLRRDYLDAVGDPARPFPTLRRLMSEGAVARSLRSVWPSVTYPAHTTMVTGVMPARHGIVNNVVFDPLEKNEGGWYWYASDIRVPTLWDAASKAGVDVLNVTWPVTVSAPIRWNVPQIWRARTDEDDKLLVALATPGILESLPRSDWPSDHHGDAARAHTASALLRAKRPRLAFVYLTDLDSAQHDAGPLSPKAWATLEATDRLLGEIIGAAQAAAPRVSLVLVSDHGFAPVARDVRPNVALREAGLLTVAPPRDDLRRDASNLRGFAAVTWKAGGVAAIMGTAAVRGQVRDVFDRLAHDPESGIARVLDGAEVEREGGFPGALVVLEAAPGAMFSERTDPPMVVPSKYRGTHGYDPSSPEMSASLVLWGDGIRKDAALGDVAMIDIAPTIAALAGLHLQTAAGHALVSALIP